MLSVSEASQTLENIEILHFVQNDIHWKIAFYILLANHLLFRGQFGGHHT